MLGRLSVGNIVETDVVLEPVTGWHGQCRHVAGGALSREGKRCISSQKSALCGGTKENRQRR